MRIAFYSLYRALLLIGLVRPSHSKFVIPRPGSGSPYAHSVQFGLRYTGVKVRETPFSVPEAKSSSEGGAFWRKGTESGARSLGDGKIVIGKRESACKSEVNRGGRV